MRQSAPASAPALPAKSSRGALIGGLIGGVAGLLLGLARQAALYARVSGLEEQVKFLREGLRRLESAAPESEAEAKAGAETRAEPAPKPATTRIAPDLGAPSVMPPGATADATLEPAPAPRSAPPAATPTPPAPETAGFNLELPDSVLEQVGPPTADRTRSASPEDGWESSSSGERQPAASTSPSSVNALVAFLFGGNTIARVGVAILFTGVAFLAKYAADSGLFPIEFRLAAIGGVAILLTAFGWRLREKRRDYALLLQGGTYCIGIFSESFHIFVFKIRRCFPLNRNNF